MTKVKTKSLEEALVETEMWIKLRQTLMEALRRSGDPLDEMRIRFVETNWPEYGVPRQTEMVALERQILKLEKERDKEP